MRATPRAVLADDYWDGALQDLQQDGLQVAGDSQYLPSSRAPPEEAFGGRLRHRKHYTRGAAYEYIDGDDRLDGEGNGSESDEDDDGIVFGDLDEMILALED